MTPKGRTLARAAVKHTAAIEKSWQNDLERAGLNIQLRPLLEAAITKHGNR